MVDITSLMTASDRSVFLGRSREHVRAHVMELAADSQHPDDLRETQEIARLVFDRVCVLLPNLCVDLRELAIRTIVPIAPLASDVPELDAVIQAFGELMAALGSLRAVIETARANGMFKDAIARERARRPGWITPEAMRLVEDMSQLEHTSTRSRIADDHLSFSLTGPHVAVIQGSDWNNQTSLIAYSVPIVIPPGQGPRKTEAPDPTPKMFA